MSATGRTQTAGIVRLRRLFLLVAVAIVAGIVIGVTRFDLGDTINELTLPLRHDDIIRQQAAEKGVPADLIAAVIFEESKFQDQTSSAGARGLMQITPDTAETIETLSGGETFVYDDLADPELNIRYGTFYLAYLLDKYEGDVVAALAAYNAGEGNADAWGGAGMKLDDIEFPETYDYVRDVIERRREYRKKYPEELGLK
jgi:soluble lytic murein transglycosylase